MSECACIVCGRKFIASSEHRWIVTGHKRVCSYTCMNKFFEEKDKNSPNAIEHLDRNGNLIAVYKNIADAADKTGLDQKTVSKYVRQGYNKNLKEFWRRKNQKNIDKSVNK